MVNNKIKDLTTTGILIALVLSFTFIRVPLPIALRDGGLIHLGNVMVVVATLVFGKSKGVLSASLGMGLFDILSGYANWALYTIVIRGISTYVMGTIAFKKFNGNNNIINFIAVLIANIINMVGYFFAEYFIYGNFISPISSIPGEIIQVCVSLFLGLPLTNYIKKLNIS